MIRTNIQERTNEKYEVQWYNAQGDNSHVTQCDTAQELAAVLARACWGSIKFKNNPTIYYYGEPFCKSEWQAADEETSDTAPFPIVHTIG